MGFIDFLAQANKTLNQMHYMHSTTFENFTKIYSIQPTKLTPKECEMFKEDLIYLFYGVPSYRVSDSVGTVTDYSLYPVCFVLDLNGFTQIERIYPFDSGAFYNGRYGDYIKEYREIDDFCLGTDPDIPKSVVEVFFGSNRNYYLGEYNRILDIAVSDFEVQEYYNMISATGESRSHLDRRRSSIEIHTKQELVLDKNNVLLVVLPESVMDDTMVKRTINQIWQADFRTYATHRFSAPGDFDEVIYNLIRNYLKEEGVL